jgi:hypothetical protein
MGGKTRKAMLAAASIGAVALVMALTPTGRAVAQGTTALLVEVVNVPQVNVANVPRVQSAQSGSWTVAIGNSSRDPVPILDVGLPAKQTYRARVLCIATSGNTCTETLTVPSGKLLVIETYSAFCGPGTSTGAVRSSIAIDESVGPSSEFFFALEPNIFGGVGLGGLGRHHVITAHLRLYADPGTEVSFGFWKNPTGSTLWCEASISGLLADCNSAPGCPVP